MFPFFFASLFLLFFSCFAQGFCVSPTLSKPSKELNVNVAGSALMIGIYMGHQGVTGAVYPLADDASVLLLSRGMLVGDVAFQGCFAAQLLVAQLAAEQLLR